ncbi:MAG: TIGR02996 domain-containing protein [Gemmataceae bacterium]|nr:TIGR02996 domain-containing protein [Gemmataceae bacterium]
MTADELLFALAPDAKAVAAVRAVDTSRFTRLRRSRDGEWLQGDVPDWGTVRVRLTSRSARCGHDCPSMKYPCKHAIALALLALADPGRFSPAEPSAAFRRDADDWPEAELPQPAAAPKDAGEALLQAVFDDPDDVAAPLVYADWLSENGGEAEQDRAAFIRAQHRAATSEGAEKRAAEAEADALLEKRREEWTEGVTHLGRRAFFDRGFIRRLRLTNTDLLHNEDVLRLHPVREIEFTGDFTRKPASGLAVLDWWKRLRVLDFTRCKLEVGDLALFLSNIHLSGVRELRLAGKGLGGRGLKLLCDWPGLASVRVLGLERTFLAAKSMERLCASPHLGGLRVLRLEGNGLSSADARALAACPGLAGLEELGLGECPVLGDNGARIVEASFPALKRVSLSASGVKETTKKALRHRFGDGLRWE